MLTEIIQKINEAIILLIPTIAAIVLPVLALMVKAVVQRIIVNFDINTKAAVMQFFNETVSAGVALAEQKAKVFTKETTEKMSSDDKLLIATQYVINEIHKHKLVGITIEEIQKRIEACLGTGVLNTELMIQGDDEDDEEDENNDD